VFGFAASIGFSALGILLGAVLGAVVSIALGIIWVSLTFLIGRRFFWRKIGLLVTRKARILLKLSRTDIPHYVDPSVPVPDVARAIGIAWIAISTVIAAKTALGLDTQRSLVIFIIVTFIVLFSYGLIASL